MALARQVERVWRKHPEVLRLGGLSYPQSAVESARDRQAYCLKVIRITRRELEQRFGWSLARLDVFFVAHSDANAQLLRQGDRYGVALYAGLPELIHAYITAALATREFLQLYLAPEEREEWALRFLGMVVEHVYLHEAAHALRGHLLYLERTTGETTVDERFRWQRRYIELDADVHAVDMWLEITEAAADFPASEGLRLDLYFQKLLTLILLHQAYDRDGRPVQRRGRATHPAAIHRAMLIDQMLFGTFRDRYQLSREAMLNVQNQAWWEASVAAEAAGLVKNRWWGESGSRRGDKQFKRMWRYFVTTIEPRLDRFVEGLPEDLT